jgi:hypothetical protein
MRPRLLRRKCKAEQDKQFRAKVRKHLSAEARIRSIRGPFERLGEPRNGEPEIPLEEAFMSAFAMLSVKGQCLLAWIPTEMTRLNHTISN